MNPNPRRRDPIIEAIMAEEDKKFLEGTPQLPTQEQAPDHSADPTTRSKMTPAEKLRLQLRQKFKDEEDQRVQRDINSTPEQLEQTLKRLAQELLDDAPKLNSWHQHHKGGKYRLVAKGIDEATREPRFMYQSDEYSYVWDRKAIVFLEPVKWPDGSLRPRFSPIPTPISYRLYQMVEPFTTWPGGIAASALLIIGALIGKFL
jgi:hypothetical protein